MDMTPLETGLQDLGVEVIDESLSIPVGHAEAIEIEHQDTTEMVEITFRRWDRTGGLAEEVLLATVRPAAPMVEAVVRALVEEYQKQQDSIERDITAAFAEED